jgi:hypothetical protein
MPQTIALLLILGIALMAFVGWYGGRQLNARFTALGDVKGLSRAEIIAAVGEPTGLEYTVKGITTLEWHKGRYRAVLGFEGDTCIGAMGQSAA